jgi:uncharacterized protein (DUF58 family)
MTNLSPLATDAAQLDAGLAPLLLQAEQLSQAVAAGEHGRRRPGVGDDFWQFRPFTAGVDTQKSVDWRRSARADQLYVRTFEWKTAQSLALSVDNSANMHDRDSPSKWAVSAVLATALAGAAVRAGERVGSLDNSVPVGYGHGQIARMMMSFSDTPDTADSHGPRLVPKSKAAIFSDFLGDLASTHRALEMAHDRQGPVVFADPQGMLHHETQGAHDLRDRYLQRLADRYDLLDQMAVAAGWQVERVVTDQSLLSAVTRLHSLLSQGQVA